MPDIFYLLSKWRKQILFIVLLSTAVAVVAYFISPSRYMSVSTALPASSFTADKARIFNENIEALYSVLGTADELDMITGTGKLDTLYLAVTDGFRLHDYYKVSEKGEAARNKAAALLKKYSKVMKSEYGELKVKVWDKDKEQAAAMANALMEKIRSMHQDLQNESNRLTLESLEKARNDLKMQVDSIPAAMQSSFSERLLKYETLIADYRLMTGSRPPVLLVVEKARPSQWPDKPTLITVLAVSIFLSFLFSLLLAVVFEKRKQTGS